jgi:hypothetical protein
MGQLISAIVLMIALFFAPAAKAETITVDGDKNDWATIAPIIVDPSGDINLPWEDLLEVKVTNDLENVYFLLQYAGNPEFGFQFFGP